MQNIHSSDDNYFRYLPVGGTDKLWQLYTTTVGKVCAAPGAPYPYNAEEHPPSYTHNWSGGRVLSEFQFVYITGGTGRFRSFQGESAISPGTVLILVPGERHWYQPDRDTGWTEYWIGFSGEFAEAWLDRGFIDREQPVCRYGVSQSLLSVFSEALELVKNDPPCLQQMVSSLIPRIQAMIYARQKSADPPSEGENFFEQARILFESHIYGKFDIETITKDLSVSYYTLREYFNQHTGMSPYHYFLQMKINKAKELLLRGDKSVKEVSFELAFDSPYYFSRLFKKKTGVSPSKWNGADLPMDMELWEEKE